MPGRGTSRANVYVKDGVADSVPRLEDALGHTEQLDLHSRSFPNPIERIESLRPALRFRVPLGEGAHELEVLR